MWIIPLLKHESPIPWAKTTGSCRMSWSCENCCGSCWNRFASELLKSRPSPTNQFCALAKSVISDATPSASSSSRSSISQRTGCVAHKSGPSVVAHGPLPLVCWDLAFALSPLDQRLSLDSESVKDTVSLEEADAMRRPTTIDDSIFLLLVRL